MQIVRILCTTRFRAIFEIYRDLGWKKVWMQAAQQIDPLSAMNQSTIAFRVKASLIGLQNYRKTKLRNVEK